MKWWGEAILGKAAAAAGKLPIDVAACAALTYVPRSAAESVLGEQAVQKVAPTAIAGEVRLGRAGKRWLIAEGDWDLNAKPPQQTRTYQLMQMLVRYGPEFRRSELYQQMAERLSRRGLIKTNITMFSVTDLDAYMQSRLKLVERLQEEGVRAAVSDPVGVAIGRDGRFVRCGDGRHRLSAALLLGVEPISVRIEHLHTEFVASAARNGRGTLHSKLLRHIQAAATAAAV